MARKLLIYTLIMLFALQSVAAANSGGMTVLDKTAAVEKILYGEEQTGALIERVNKIENDMYGTSSNNALINKVDRVYSYIKENSAQPSFLIKLNAVEWALSHNVTTQPAKVRIENLEVLMVGGAPQGSLDDRLTRLAQLAYSGGKVTAAATTMNKDNLIKISISSPLSTKDSRVGDVVSFQVADDVYVEIFWSLPRALRGKARLPRLKPPRILAAMPNWTSILTKWMPSTALLFILSSVIKPRRKPSRWPLPPGLRWRACCCLVRSALWAVHSSMVKILPYLRELNFLFRPKMTLRFMA
jgi:hypothetical protein